MTVHTETIATQPVRSLALKWGDAIGAGGGFVAVPLPLLRLQAKLGLSPTDLVVLVNLLAHWWTPTAGVFPRTSTIAARMGVTERTVQRSMSKLVRLGLAKREFDSGGRRTFNFLPLATRLQLDLPLAMKMKGSESIDA